MLSRRVARHAALASQLSVRQVASSPRIDQIKADHDHCVNMVQQRDKEGYLCGLLMPAHAQKQYFALRAFNAELASIKDGSERRQGRPSEEAGASLALRMRMQWWREAIDELYPHDQSSSEKDPRSESIQSMMSSSYWHNPVVRALNRAVQESNLTRRFLERLLAAREADLDIAQLPNMDNLIMYAEDSSSSLLYLTLECCNVRDDAADEVASNVGVGNGIVTAIRSATYRSMKGELSIPADVLSRSITADYLLAKQDPDYKDNSENDTALREAVQHMAYVASGFLARARDAQEKVPKQGRCALLPAIPSIRFLSKLKEVNYDLFDDRLHPDHHRLVLLAMMARGWMTGRF